MHSVLQEICTALDSISATIISQTTHDNTYCETYGWNCLSLTRHDLSEQASILSADIKQSNIDKIEVKTLKKIADFPRKLNSLMTNTIPQIPSGNNVYAGSAYLSTIQSMRTVLEPIIFPEVPPPPPPPSWEQLVETKALPSQLIKRLRSIQAEIEQIMPDKEELASQVKLIKEAHETAESLPIDMKALSDARIRVDKLATDAAVAYEKVDGKQKEILQIADEITLKKGEAVSIVEKCEEAYHITTTKGLAAAFDQRANKLAISMWAWVVGLLIALGIGASVGSHRIDQLNTALSSPNAQIGLIWIQVALSLLSVGAPVWFAWLATKQIGHRFKLSEDYAFKASVAKAYEGYRKEAVKLDKDFEARLFSSALTRLEEAPLRLVDEETHGSPWHEVFFSRFGKKNDLNKSGVNNEPTAS